MPNQQESSSKQGRPNRYTPTEVNLTNLYHLHRDFEYVSMLNENNADIQGFSFKRPDGKIINYFPAIQDSSGKYPYPDLETWLKSYKNLVSENKIKLNDITIVPLLQVIGDRQHFNTLVVFIDEKKMVYAYIIEPYRTNITSSNFFLPYSYPLEGIGIGIRNYLSRSVKGVNEKNDRVNETTVLLKHIHTGQQPFYDNNNCGAHQINYTEIISHMSDDEMKNKLLFEKRLEGAYLARREQDKKKITEAADKFPQATQNYQQTSQQQVEDDEIELDKNAEKEKKERKDENKPLEKKKRFVITENENENENEKEKEKEKGKRKANKNKQSAKGKKEQPENKTIIDHVINIINEYRVALDEYRISTLEDCNFFKRNIFTRHTRHETAKGLVEVLNKIKSMNTDEVIKNYKAAHLLLACYVSITSCNSQLRMLLEVALAKLLDCELESRTSCVNKEKLFSHRIKSLGNIIPSDSQIPTKNKIEMFQIMKNRNAKEASLFGGADYNSKDFNTIADKLGVVNTNDNTESLSSTSSSSTSTITTRKP